MILEWIWYITIYLSCIYFHESAIVFPKKWLQIRNDN